MISTTKKAAYRTLHYAMKIALPIINFPMPEVYSGPGKIRELPGIVRKFGIKKAQIVTDKGLMGIGLLNGLFEALEKEGVEYSVFDEVQPNPTIDNIEEGVRHYLGANCEGIIAFGGGSPMDCAKIIGARVNSPKRSVLKMRGKFKIFHKLPPMFAVPTTAGTGSETTVAAVINDSKTHEKFPIISMKIVPPVAILDPELMVGLPPHITSTTGMDALTHAVEAYIGLHGTRFTDDNAEKAVNIIFNDLEDVYREGSNLEKRTNLALASFYAGAAFTRAQVGYVHAIAHTMGGLYGTPHGLANAIILPYVLEYSRADAENKLASLAVAGGIGQEDESPEELSHRFIEKVKTINAKMGIPDKIEDLQEKDISFVVEKALAESNPNYPVPTIMSPADCEALVRKLIQ